MSHYIDHKVRIERMSIPVTETGCWLWTGQTLGKQKRYPKIMVGGRKGKYIAAHRVSYAAFVGPIPEGMSVLHKCDIPLCVNPSHLFLGNQADNMRDMKIKGRSTKGRKLK